MNYKLIYACLAMIGIVAFVIGLREPPKPMNWRKGHHGLPVKGVCLGVREAKEWNKARRRRAGIIGYLFFGPLGAMYKYNEADRERLYTITYELTYEDGYSCKYYVEPDSYMHKQFEELLAQLAANSNTN